MSLKGSDAEVDATTSAQRWSSSAFVTCGTVLITALASFAIFTTASRTRQGDQFAASFQLDLQDQIAISEELVHYRLHSQVDLPLDQVRAIATGPLDEICVAGDTAVHIFSNNGIGRSVVELDFEPSCLAVAGNDHTQPGQLFVGASDAIHVFGASGQPVGSWQVPEQQAILTSIAVGEDDIFVADAGNRLVWRFNAKGRLVGRIGVSGENQRDYGLVVPGPYLDVVVGAADLVHVTNPGKLQIATYTFDGDFGTAWGRADSTLSGFFGCCNPSHLAVLSDGRFVTAEKGIPRIKVYSPGGAFETVVAGPQQLGINEQSIGDPRFGEDRTVFDIAVDSRGRVLVLDATFKKVLIFVLKDHATTGNNA